MDGSGKQMNVAWVNRALGIPPAPANRRDFYPFSRCTALIYRLKLAFLLLVIASCALCRPDLVLPILLNSWLLFVTCEAAHGNYPWREPLYAWMWSIRLAVPYSEAIFCSALLLVWSQWGAGCEMPRPMVSASVFWLCCMVAWPLVRRRWHRESRTVVDYDQFRAVRPRVLTLPRSLELVLATLQSPSLLVPLVVGVSACVATPFLPWWAADAWAACTGAFVLGCLALLCCRNLPLRVQLTRDQWKEQEAEHARKISNILSEARHSLSILGEPMEGSHPHHRLSVQVPLLQREAGILLKAGRTLGERKIRELRDLPTGQPLAEFGAKLDEFGPYTTRCCVS